MWSFIFLKSFWTYTRFYILFSGKLKRFSLLDYLPLKKYIIMVREKSLWISYTNPWRKLLQIHWTKIYKSFLPTPTSPSGRWEVLGSNLVLKKTRAKVVNSFMTIWIKLPHAESVWNQSSLSSVNWPYHQNLTASIGQL